MIPWPSGLGHYVAGNPPRPVHPARYGGPAFAMTALYSLKIFTILALLGLFAAISSQNLGASSTTACHSSSGIVVSFSFVPPVRIFASPPQYQYPGTPWLAEPRLARCVRAFSLGSLQSVLVSTQSLGP